MNEIEIGARINFDVIEKKLISLGAVKQKDQRQVDTICQLSHRELGRHEVVRLREKSGEVEITYKEPILKKVDVVSRREISFRTSAEEGKMFLEALGAKPLVVVDKVRRIYKLKDFNIGLDKVKDLGEFIEIELMGANKEIARKRILSLMEKLDINVNSLMGKPYFLMLLEKSEPKSI